MNVGIRGVLEATSGADTVLHAEEIVRNVSKSRSQARVDLMDNCRFFNAVAGRVLLIHVNAIQSSCFLGEGVKKDSVTYDVLL